MLKQITHSQVYVLDQDEALDFSVEKLGLEVNTDADLGFMRWLTLNVPGDPQHQILLEQPSPPAVDEATAEQIRELVTKGAMGVAGIFTVDDIHKAYEELRAKGVEFTEEPTERSYGTDCGLRDPFGNRLRIGQPKDGPRSRKYPATIEPVEPPAGNVEQRDTERYARLLVSAQARVVIHPR